ncbi:MAG: hypothetical protein K2X69_16385 [Silvanigrellaceae bacterium]|nr:hypothetical protein [Silvanigrellaceae bacterium]
MKKIIFSVLLFILVLNFVEISCVNSDYYYRNYKESSTIDNIKDGLMYVGGMAIGVTLFKIIQANTENYFQKLGIRTNSDIKVRQETIWDIHSDFQGYHVIEPNQHKKKKEVSIQNYVAANGQLCKNRFAAYMLKDGWQGANILGGKNNQLDSDLTSTKAKLSEINKEIDQEIQRVKEYNSVEESEFVYRYFPKIANRAIHLKQASNRIITNLEEERVKTNKNYQKIILDQKQARANFFDEKSTRFA